MRESNAFLAQLVRVLPFLLSLPLFCRRPQVAEPVNERALLREQHQQWQKPGAVHLPHRRRIME